MSGGRLNLLEVCGEEDGDSEERAEHSVGEEEEEEGGEQDRQLDHQAGRHVDDGVHLCTELDSTVQYSRMGQCSAVQWYCKEEEIHGEFYRRAKSTFY